MTKRQGDFMNQTETQAMLAAMESDQKGGASSFWTPEADENNIRFLPPVKSKQEVLPYFHHKVHWIDGTPYECIAQSFTDKKGNFHEAETCPACKQSKKLYKIGEKDSEERDLAYELSGKDRYVFRIVDRAKDEATRVIPEFYEVGPTIFKKFFGIMKGGKYGNIVHPLEGRDFIIDKQGTGRRTNYDNSMPDPNITQIFSDKAELTAVLTAIKEMDYSQLVQFPSADEIKIAVDEFLGSDPTPEAKVAPATKAKTSSQETEVEVVTDVPDAKTEEANEDDVDSILSEFI
jgi:hypothetical protein